ncbi:hypothetical protein C2S51_004017 [Perilla frutescens var. frutescens]|nr:hypothetical protein C2S51_004017 [Perilla frutescens var. frutescens]
MGADILVKKKGERRFLSRVDDDDDDGRSSSSNFSLEIFHDFFNHHHDSSSAVVDPFLHEDGGDDSCITAEDRRIHWESQQFLLQEIIEQYHSIGSKLREEIKREIEIAREWGFCINCERRCTANSCLRRAAVNQLRSKGFNAALSVSQWKATHNTPPGWHEYIEVRGKTQGKGKKNEIVIIPIIFVVEVGFRDEFRMGKASEEYKKLIEQLPEMYIGKREHMKAIIRLLCDAAKKSAAEQNIHMGPWRTNNFMQMKWSTPAPTTSSASSQDKECFTARLPMPTTLKVA